MNNSSYMTVGSLIEYLKQYPENMPVGTDMYSDYCLLEPCQIEVKELCPTRSDGWIESKRPDKPSCKYLIFSSN